jgi:hypothetical protein
LNLIHLALLKVAVKHQAQQIADPKATIKWIAHGRWAAFMAGLLICCSIAYLMSRQAGSWYAWD